MGGVKPRVRPGGEGHRGAPARPGKGIAECAATREVGPGHACLLPLHALLLEGEVSHEHVVLLLLLQVLVLRQKQLLLLLKGLGRQAWAHPREPLHQPPHGPGPCTSSRWQRLRAVVGLQQKAVLRPGVGEG